MQPLVCHLKLNVDDYCGQGQLLVFDLEIN
jgi:hypothetical protein